VNKLQEILEWMIEEGINTYDFFIDLEEIRFNVKIKKEVDKT